MWLKFTDIRSLVQAEGPDVTLINLDNVSKVTLSPNMENVLFYDMNGDQLHDENPSSLGKEDFEALIKHLAGNVLEIPGGASFGTKEE